MNPIFDAHYVYGPIFNVPYGNEPMLDVPYIDISYVRCILIVILMFL